MLFLVTAVCMHVAAPIACCDFALVSPNTASTNLSVPLADKGVPCYANYTPIAKSAGGAAATTSILTLAVALLAVGMRVLA